MTTYTMNDASTLAFVQSQMSHIETAVYRRKYPDIQYSSLIPVDTSANEWAKTVTFYSMDGVGQAKFISGNSDDIPLVNLNKDQYESGVHMAAIGYGFNIEEVNQARMLNINLPSEDAMVARRVYEEFVDSSLLVAGDAAKGMNPLINYPGITTVVAPAGAAGPATWLSKTADEVLLDINNLLSGVWIDSRTVEVSDTLLISETAYVNLATKRIDGTDTTLMAYVMANNVLTMRTGRALTIRTVRGLESAGVGGVERAVAYRNDMEVLKAHVPMPLRFLPMQTRNLHFYVPGIFRFGGLDIRLPAAVRYLDGI